MIHRTASGRKLTHSDAPHTAVGVTPHNPESYDEQLERASAKVAGWLRTLIDPDQVVELRAPKVQDDGHENAVYAGTFRGTELHDMARCSLALSGRCPGVYWTINPLVSTHQLRQAPRVQRVGSRQLAKDQDVLARRWLLVDRDPVRTKGHENDSATDAETVAAWDTLLAVKEELSVWNAPPTVMKSGNGFYLLYPLAGDLPLVLPLPGDDPVKRLLRYLAHKFNSSQAKIDTTVYNPSRIAKVPGTLACKGNNTPERPHRRAKLLEIPDCPRSSVTTEQIALFAALAPAEPSVAAKPTRREPTRTPKLRQLSPEELARRVPPYFARIPGAISGEGGHHHTMRQIGKVLRGFNATPETLYPHADAWNQAKCKPPWSKAELMHKLREAAKHPGDRGFLFDRDDPEIGDDPNEPQTDVETILAYFRELYSPVYRRSQAAVCQDGSEVTQATACSVPNSVLIGRLANATDAPCFPGEQGTPGAIKKPALPGFFNTWAKVAWGDLLHSLPGEDEAELGAVGAARDEFLRLVRDAMPTQIVLGEAIRDSSERMQIERRSLIDWCYKFAKPGPWRTIRSYRCWCKCVDKGGGEIELKVAIRYELFAQLKADRRLTQMGANKFTRRAARYGVGASAREDRPHGLSAVVLASEFVADLIAGLPDDDQGEAPET